MVFGLEGSRMLVNVANIVMRDIPTDVKWKKSKDGNIIDAMRENASKLLGHIKEEAGRRDEL